MTKLGSPYVISGLCARLYGRVCSYGKLTSDGADD